MAKMSDKPQMNWSADNLPDTFELFKQRCEIYFEIKDIPVEKQVSHILFSSGEEGLRRYNAWRLPDADKKKPDIIWTRFSSEIVKPSENFRVARLRMQKLLQ